MPSSLKNTHIFYDNASKFTNIPEDYLNLLKTPHSVLKINIPLVRDNGTFESITAYRCHHKMHKLPLKGGIRISPKMTIENIEAGAMLKTI
jgi:glutamate dehydrogenase (NAD(P)+)